MTHPRHIRWRPSPPPRRLPTPRRAGADRPPPARRHWPPPSPLRRLNAPYSPPIPARARTGTNRQRRPRITQQWSRDGTRQSTAADGRHHQVLPRSQGPQGGLLRPAPRGGSRPRRRERRGQVDSPQDYDGHPPGLLRTLRVRRRARALPVHPRRPGGGDLDRPPGAQYDGRPHRRPEHLHRPRVALAVHLGPGAQPARPAPHRRLRHRGRADGAAARAQRGQGPAGGDRPRPVLPGHPGPHPRRAHCGPVGGREPRPA